MTLKHKFILVHIFWNLHIIIFKKFVKMCIMKTSCIPKISAPRQTSFKNRVRYNCLPYPKISLQWPSTTPTLGSISFLCFKMPTLFVIICKINRIYSINASCYCHESNIFYFPTNITSMFSLHQGSTFFPSTVLIDSGHISTKAEVMVMIKDMLAGHSPSESRQNNIALF